MDELLDLVNENDEIIGEVWKSKANSDQKLIHREIIVYIFDQEKRLLMQQRSWKKKVYPGYWTESCAGHIGKGENPEIAAHRELKEELGFDTKLKFINKRLIVQPNEIHFAYCYIGRYKNKKIEIDKEEIETIEFVNESGFDKFFEGKKETKQGDLNSIKKYWEYIK